MKKSNQQQQQQHNRNGGAGGLMRMSGGMSKSTLSLMNTAAPMTMTPSTKGGSHRRKTSAEIVSEAKSMLASSVGKYESCAT